MIAPYSLKTHDIVKRTYKKKRTPSKYDHANTRTSFTEETKKLVDMFPDGLEGWLSQQEAQKESESAPEKNA